MLLEFAQQYEKLTDEEKSDLAQTAKSSHREYVQEMMGRVREPVRPRIRIDLSHKDSEGQGPRRTDPRCDGSYRTSK